MAYFSEYLAAGLYLYSFGGQPEGKIEKVCEYFCGFYSQRLVAWDWLQVFVLGVDACIVSDWGRTDRGAAEQDI